MPDRIDINALAQIAERETQEYLRRSSMGFLECAVHLMATHMSVEEVAGILEEQARIIREFE